MMFYNNLNISKTSGCNNTDSAWLDLDYPHGIPHMVVKNSGAMEKGPSHVIAIKIKTWYQTFNA